MQCERQNSYLPFENQETYMKQCQDGTLPPTPCTNITHTHCIFSFYKQFENNDRVVYTERKCGVAEDDIGCTLYRSSNNGNKRAKKHLLTGGSRSNTQHHRRETNLFVHVCTLGCPGEKCPKTNSSCSTTLSKYVLLLTSFSFLYLSYV
uniref:Uncharacterized protein n=1 Tax=Rhabditophanes sp. KR3021 TaxID=114890 RepID=A0AC35U7E4_9BILA